MIKSESDKDRKAPGNKNSLFSVWEKVLAPSSIVEIYCLLLLES